MEKVNIKSLVNNLTDEQKAIFDLNQIVNEAQAGFFKEMSDSFRSRLQDLIRRRYILLAEQEGLERTLVKIKERVAKNIDSLERVKAGDWNVLFKLEENQENKQDE
jgi:hypothetical protein